MRVMPGHTGATNSWLRKQAERRPHDASLRPLLAAQSQFECPREGLLERSLVGGCAHSHKRQASSRWGFQVCGPRAHVQLTQLASNGLSNATQTGHCSVRCNRVGGRSTIDITCCVVPSPLK